MSKISVIIPNYNHARFLEKRIQSVLNQTCQDFELIILDDASTDDSKQVIEKFLDDKRIRTIYNQTNSGSPFKQWNKGIKEAKGEYIWIAESDDYADKSLLSELVARLDEHPTVGIAYCQSWIVDEHYNVLFSGEEWNANLDEQRWKSDFVNNGKNECSQYVVFQCTIPNASAVLIRRSVYEQVGGPDEKMRLCGDWMLWAKMLLISDIAFIAKPLNYFRTHSNTVRNASAKKAVNIEESYKFLSYLLSNTSVSDESINKICDEMARQWVNNVVTERGRVSLERQKYIYQIANKVDPKLRRRLIRKFSTRLFEAVNRRLVLKNSV